MSTIKYIILLNLTLSLIGCVGEFDPRDPADPADPTGLIDPKTAEVEVFSIQAVYPLNGKEWNDWIARSNSQANDFSQPDETCSSDGSLAPDKCFHAGELRKAEISSLSSCQGLQITDYLRAFEWSCIESGSKVLIHSSQLGKGKGLSSLLEMSGWKDNQVIVKNNSGEIVGISNIGKWWSNPVTPLPMPTTNSGSVVLSSEGTIYVFDSDRKSFGYNLNANKVGLVGLNGARLIDQGYFENRLNKGFNRSTFGEPTPASWYAAISGGAQKYLWVEASYLGIRESDAHRTLEGLFFYEVQYSVFRNLDLSIADIVFVCKRCASNRFESIHLGKNQGNFYAFGMTLTEIANYNRIKDVHVYNNIIKGLSISHNGANRAYPSKGNKVDGFYGHAGSETPLVIDSDENQLTNIDIKTYKSYPMVLSGDNNVISKFKVDGSDQTTVGPPLGIKLSGERNTLSQGIISSALEGLWLTTGDQNYFTHITIVGINYNPLIISDSSENTFNQIVVANTSGYGSNSAIRIFDHPSNFSPPSQSNIFSQVVVANNSKDGFESVTTTEAPIFDNNIILGSNGLNDCVIPTNEFDSNCKPTIAMNLFNLVSGIDLNGSFDADYNISPNEPWLYNKSGNGKTSNSSFIVNQNCPAAVHGDYVTLNQAQYPQKFLSNALELIGDRIGDDDGLCESDEACMYSPHFGAHYNMLPDTSITCNFQNGIVSGVQMHPGVEIK